MNEHLSVRIDDELKGQLQEAAGIMSLGISDITRWILRKHLPGELEKLRELEDVSPISFRYHPIISSSL